MLFNLEMLIFAYPARPELNVLKDFNLNLEPNKTTALVGHSGSGKTTVALLLTRLYDVGSGEITLEQHSIKSFDPVGCEVRSGWFHKSPF